MNRRLFLTAAAAVPLARTLEPVTAEPATSEPATAEPATSEPATSEPATSEPATAEPATSVPDLFPMQERGMVQEMVTVSHFNPKRVRELVEAHPALARAAMDWGFGDWEDALGAA